MPFVLFLQAIMFYMPHFIWRNLESNTLRKLLDGLMEKSVATYVKKGKNRGKYGRHDDSDVDEDEDDGEGGQAGDDERKLVDKYNKRFVPKSERDLKIYAVVKYLCASIHQHDKLYIGFVVCELLNFVNVVGNIFFTDHFLGGEFTTYGQSTIRTKSFPFLS